MEIGFHALAFLVDRVDLVAAAVFLDAIDTPALLDQHFFELVLRLPGFARPGIASGQTVAKLPPDAINTATTETIAKGIFMDSPFEMQVAVVRASDPVRATKLTRGEFDLCELRQFPFVPSSFCMRVGGPDIPSFLGLIARR